jgi:hypothetical protein
MITFAVVKEEHGWAVHMGERMTSPFRSRDVAIREATLLAEAIGGHGERTEVIVEGVGPGERLKRIGASSPCRFEALLRGAWIGQQ